eukprot:9252394-Pyramimonas_sp.AAC.1
MISTGPSSGPAPGPRSRLNFNPSACSKDRGSARIQPRRTRVVEAFQGTGPRRARWALFPPESSPS